jgi:hypothetical protein
MLSASDHCGHELQRTFGGREQVDGFLVALCNRVWSLYFGGRGGYGQAWVS